MPEQVVPAPRRWWVGVVLAVPAVWILVRNDVFRHYEAVAFAPLVSVVTRGHDAVAAHSIIWFGRNGSSMPLGLDVTSECTTAVLIVPLIAVLAAFGVFSRIPLIRVALALVCGIASLVTCNAIRIAVIAFSTDVWGLDPGYQISHVFVGSALSLIGFVASVGISVWLLVRTRPAPSHVSVARHRKE